MILSKFIKLRNYKIMKTLEKITEIKTNENLVNYIELTLKRISKKIKEEQYQFNLNLEDIVIPVYEIKNLSWTRTKKINKKLRKVNRIMTPRSINMTLNYIFKKSLSMNISVSIKSSLKEEIIQRKRREWKKQRDIANKLLQEYKDEKGDYYKRKL